MTHYLRTLLFLAVLVWSGVALSADQFVPDRPARPAVDTEKFPRFYTFDEGQVRVDWKDTGEPMNEPAHVKVSIQCKGSSTYRVLSKDIGMGDKPTILFDGPNQSLKFFFHTCHVIPSTGDTKCDIPSPRIPYPISGSCTSSSYRVPDYDAASIN